MPGHKAYIGSYYEDKIGTLKLLFHEEMLLGKRSITVTSFYINLSFIFIVSRDTPGCWDIFLIFLGITSFWINFGHGTAILGGFLGSPRPVSQKFFEPA